MKKSILICLLCVGSIGAATPLGVLYESTATNNVVSPTYLTAPNIAISTNLTLSAQPASYAVQLNAAKQLVGGLLSGAQQDTLASWVGGSTTLNLGAAQIIGGVGTPTNGTAYVTRILYINSTGTNLNDTYWGNYGANWYAIASTNGGSITESQLNLSDNTTANATTNRHGLLIKLDGSTTKFLRADGTWFVPQNNLSNILSGTRYLGFYDSASSAFTYYKTNYATVNGTSLILPNIDLLAGGEILGDATTDILVGDVSAWNTVGINGVAASSLLRLDGLNKVRAVTIGGGLAFDGVTLSQSGVGTNAVGITGSPAATYLTYWSAPNTITGSAGATFDGSTLRLNGTVQATHYNIPTGDIGSADSGNLTSGTYLPVYGVLANAGSFQNYAQHYIRVGNEITVSGRVSFSRVAGGNNSFEMTLPVASTLTITTGLVGSGMITDNLGTNPIGPVRISPSAGLNKAKFDTLGSSTTGVIREIYYSFTYTVN